MVAVEPGTGRVLAYYGGHDGKGNDYAGFYFDENGEATGVGRYPPGSSFKVYTLAAALKAGYLAELVLAVDRSTTCPAGPSTTRSVTRATARPTTTRPPGRQVGCVLAARVDDRVAERAVLRRDASASAPAKVLEMARDAGIDYMWTDDRERQDLRSVADMADVVARRSSTSILGIGQYPVTVMDHANGVATFAAGGLRAKAHFVKEVTKNGETAVTARRCRTRTSPGSSTSSRSTTSTFALSQVAPEHQHRWVPGRHQDRHLGVQRQHQRERARLERRLHRRSSRPRSGSATRARSRRIKNEGGDASGAPAYPSRSGRSS